MLSCLVPPRFGQEDKISSMPSSPPFSMQFPSLASSLHHHSQSKNDDSSQASSAATTAQHGNGGSGLMGVGDFIMKCPQCHQRLSSFQALHEHIENEHSHEKFAFESQPPNGYHIDREIDFSSRQHHQQHLKQNHNNNNLTNCTNNNDSNSSNKNNKLYSISNNNNNNNNCHLSSSSSSISSLSLIPTTAAATDRTSSPATSVPSLHSPLAGVSAAQRTTPPPIGDLSSQYHHHAMAMAALATAAAASNGYDASAAAAMAAAEAMAMAGSRSTTSPLNGHNIGNGHGGSGGGGGGSGNCGASTASSSSSSSSSMSASAVATAAGPYQCSQCSAAFPSRDLLDKHELLHSPNSSGAVNQSCKICNKAFANVYRLQRHMISHDESALLRKFKCTQCDKAFKFKHHLKEHVRIHSGEKPFGCDNCGKRFSHSGSFSSHMTSKKCISMGLKLNNNRAMLKSLEKSGILGGSPNGKRPGGVQPPIGTNPLNYFPHGLGGGGVGGNSAVGPDGPSNPSNGGNSFYQMLPKYSDYGAMNAALLATFQNPFYNMAALNPNIHPYSIHRLLELTAAGNQRLQSDPEDLIEEVTEDVADEPKLVMDLDDCEKDTEEDNTRTYNRSDDEDDGEDSRNSNNSTPPPKQMFEESNGENMKIERNESPSPAPPAPAEVRPHSPEIKVEEEEEEEVDEEKMPQEEIEQPEPVNELRCSRCDKQFNHPTELVQHEKVLCGLIKEELEQQHQQQQQMHQQHQQQFQSNESDAGNSSYFHSGSEEEQEDREDREDRESKNGSEASERKVRVRTAITEEQQSVLKQHYAVNARPSRDEFRVIANRLALDARVVQVWFQNNRSRERKMNNGFNKCYPPMMPEPIQANSPPPAPVESVKLPSGEDQPLDLSVKKDSSPQQSSSSSTAQSPLYGSVPMQADTNEAINLSRKLSPSPTLYKQPLYYGATMPNLRPSDIPVPSHHVRQTPSPNEAMPPMPRYPTNHTNPYLMPHNGNVIGGAPRAMVPMECLFQMAPEYARSHLMGNIKLGGGNSDRGTSLSPGSEKRSWRDDESRISHDDEYMAAAAAAAAASSLMPPQQKRHKIETHGHAGDPDLPFICDQCDKAFAKQSSLARHKYEHSGQRPYKCVDCPKAFKHKHHLTEHKRLHSGEKPFQCSKCLKRFSHSGSYSQHMNHRYSYCKPYRE